MKLVSVFSTPEVFSDDCLNLLLDEAERALMQVDARADDPGRRVLHGDVPDRDLISEDVSELRLAIAELVDAYPSLPHDLEMIGERLHNVGAKAGAEAVEAHPHVLDLVRMSLEIFFRLHPSLEAFEADQRQRREQQDDVSPSASELYDTCGQILLMLRARVS